MKAQKQPKTIIWLLQWHTINILKKSLCDDQNFVLRLGDLTCYASFTYVTNSYFILWEFSTSQKELLLVSSRSISSLISGVDSSESWVLVRALGLL